MAYPLDIAAQNAALDALISRDLSGLPTQWEVALYAGDPAVGGVELAGTGGYARSLLNADLTDWPAADDGEKLSVILAFATPTGPWSATATHYLLIDHADSTTRWFPGLLAEPLTVLGTEPSVQVQLSQFWDTTGLV